WPAEKARPAPLITIARTSSRAAWRSSSALSSVIKAEDSALSWSGRLSVMTAAGGASSTTRYSREMAIANLLVRIQSKSEIRPGYGAGRGTRSRRRCIEEEHASLPGANQVADRRGMIVFDGRRQYQPFSLGELHAH